MSEVAKELLRRDQNITSTGAIDILEYLVKTKPDEANRLLLASAYYDMTLQFKFRNDEFNVERCLMLAIEHASHLVDSGDFARQIINDYMYNRLIAENDVEISNIINCIITSAKFKPEQLMKTMKETKRVCESIRESKKNEWLKDSSIVYEHTQVNNKMLDNENDIFVFYESVNMLGQYGQLFQDHGIESLDDLPLLTYNHLSEMGIKKVGHKNRIMAEIRKLTKKRKRDEIYEKRKSRKKRE